jgi:HEAT repeat protein
MQEIEVKSCLTKIQEIDRTNPDNMAALCGLFWELRQVQLRNEQIAEAAEILISIALDDAVPQDTYQNDPRIEAVWTLGTIQANEAVEPLIEILLESDYRQLRYAAASSLGDIGDKRAIATLEHSATFDSNYLSYGGYNTNIRDIAKKSLKSMGYMFNE